MSQRAYPIQYFNGGVSDLSNRGIRGAFRYGENIDLRNKTAALTGGQKMKKISGNTVTDLILFLVPTSSGDVFGFGDTGKVYKIDSNYSVTQVYDEGQKILGAAEYFHNDGAGNYVSHLVWATKTTMKKIKLSDTAGTWSPTTVGTFHRGNDNEWHTMEEGLGVLLACDSDFVAMLDYEGAFNNQALDLPHSIFSRAIKEFGNLVIIGASENKREKKGFMFTWDKLQYSWLQKKPTNARGVNSLNFLDSGILIQTGNELKYWDTVAMIPLKQLEDGAYSLPGAQAEYKSVSVMGINGGTKGNGIWGYGRRNKNSPYALNLEFVPSHGITNNKDTQIGAIANVGGTLMVSWFDGNNDFGIDIIDETQKADYIWESLEIEMDGIQFEDKLEAVKITTQPLPAGTEIIVEYRINGGPWIKLKDAKEKEKMDTEGATAWIGQASAKGAVAEIRIQGKASGNYSPTVLAVTPIYDAKEIF